MFVDAFAERTIDPDDLSLARRLLTHPYAEKIVASLLRDHLGAKAVAGGTSPPRPPRPVARRNPMPAAVIEAPPINGTSGRDAAALLPSRFSADRAAPPAPGGRAAPSAARAVSRARAPSAGRPRSAYPRRRGDGARRAAIRRCRRSAHAVVSGRASVAASRTRRTRPGSRRSTPTTTSRSCRTPLPAGRREPRSAPHRRRSRPRPLGARWETTRRRSPSGRIRTSLRSSSTSVAATAPARRTSAHALRDGGARGGRHWADPACATFGTRS